MDLEQQKKIVVLAGSGRSSTTWLDSILQSCERCEYFYEISHFPDLTIDQPDILRVKYPLTHAIHRAPARLRKMERSILAMVRKLGIQRTIADRALRINQPSGFTKYDIDIFLFKIVVLLPFTLQFKDLQARLNNRLKVIHLMCKPYSQFASERLQHFKQPEKVAFIFATGSTS